MRTITNRLLSTLEGLESDIKGVRDDYTRKQLETHLSDLKGIESDIYTSNHNGMSKFKRHIEATGNYEEVEVISYSKENDFFTFVYKDNDTVTKERYSYLTENDSFQLFFKQSY